MRANDKIEDLQKHEKLIGTAYFPNLNKCLSLANSWVNLNGTQSSYTEWVAFHSKQILLIFSRK